MAGIPKLAQRKTAISWKASREDRKKLAALKTAMDKPTIGKTLSLAVTTAYEFFGVGKSRDAAKEQ